MKQRLLYAISCLCCEDSAILKKINPFRAKRISKKHAKMMKVFNYWAGNKGFDRLLFAYLCFVKYHFVI